MVQNLRSCGGRRQIRLTMSSSESNLVERLMERIRQGDGQAIDQLLAAYRMRLKSLVRVRLDPRLQARIDPSDVVQETMLVASKEIVEYAQTQTVPFYPWLRRIACQRISDLHRRHVRTQGRSVRREQVGSLAWNDHSASLLADQLIASQTSVSQRAAREERHERVRQALQRLSAAHREVLVLLYLEHMPLVDAAAVLKSSPEAVRSRHRRALQKFGRLVAQLQ